MLPVLFLNILISESFFGIFKFSSLLSCLCYPLSLLESVSFALR